MNLPPRQRMARELRERCRQLPGGSRLDTVRKLMEEYTTSQRTVEQVLNELAADGCWYAVPAPAGMSGIIRRRKCGVIC